MDPKLFLKRLSEVSEWHRPRLGPNGAPVIGQRLAAYDIPHPGVKTEEELDEMSDQEIKEYYEQLMAWREAQPNESVPPEVLKVRPQPKNCEDCGRHCPEGRRTEKKLHFTGRPHWREYCKECEQFRDPRTREFTLPKLGSHQYFNDCYRVYKADKRGPYKKTLERQKEYDVTETREQIIKILRQKNTDIS